MAEPGDPEGTPSGLFLELLEASGPVSPRYQYSLRLRVLRRGETATVAFDLRNFGGRREGTLALAPSRFASLQRLLRALLPPGTSLDLAAGFRDRKGISFNSVAVAWEDSPARLDYLLSHLDEGEGHPEARAVVAAVKALMEP